MLRLVVLAAGQASRMGRDKLALPWGNSTVLGKVLETVFQTLDLVQSTLEPDRNRVELRVVTRKPIEAYLDGALISKFNSFGGTWLIFANPDSPRSLAESLRLGLQNLSPEISGVAFLPGDQIGVTAKGLAQLMQIFQTEEPEFLLPCLGDMLGTPVFFQKKYVQELLELKNEQGGKTVLNKYPDLWRTYPVDEDFLCDLDTPEEYSELVQQKLNIETSVGEYSYGR
ncbi:MAG: nucleotidyltransferase family protein [Desulfitobacteriaceae bacterium]